MDFIDTRQSIIEGYGPVAPSISGRHRSASNLAGHWPHVLPIVSPGRARTSPGDRGWPETWPPPGIMPCKACHPFAPVRPRATEAGQKPGRPMASCLCLCLSSASSSSYPSSICLQNFFFSSSILISAFSRCRWILSRSFSFSSWNISSSFSLSGSML